MTTWPSRPMARPTSGTSFSGVFLPAHRDEKRSFVFSAAVSSSNTSFAFPAFTARSAANSPLLHLPALRQRPRLLKSFVSATDDHLPEIGGRVLRERMLQRSLERSRLHGLA